MEAICKICYSNTPTPQSTFRNQKLALTIPGAVSLKGYGRRRKLWKNDQVGCNCKYVIMGCCAKRENCIEEKEKERKCEEMKGKVEAMEECLESEAAIMSRDDEDGKEASDYDRRAHIFDKSSKVLLALKEEEEEEEEDSITTDQT